MPSANSLTPWSTTRIVAWSCALIVSGLLFGSQFLSSFRPPDGTASDFLQEWLSAMDYWSGRSIYSPLDESLFLHTNGKADRPLLAWNAHPPVSVLLILPFGKLDYSDAHLLWNLMTFPLFACSVWLTLRELRAPLRPLSILPALALTFACYPLYYQLSQGQWNCVLAALIVAAWLADRRGYSTWAGVAVGLAASIKLFPAFLFLYFAGTGRFRALVSGGLTVVVLHLLAWAAFGEDAFATYLRDVIPSVENYRNHWQNLSVVGFVMRIFGAPGNERIVPLIDLPGLVTPVILGLRVLFAVLVARKCLASRHAATRDRGFALAIVAMLLVSPVTWPHYLLLAAMPLALVWMRLPAGSIRWCFSFVLVIFWLPNTYLASFAVGPQQAAMMMYGQHEPLSPSANLTAISLPFYALLVLLALLYRIPEEPS